jgi:tetratricopeptide (TPR) repeat protein
VEGRALASLGRTDQADAAVAEAERLGVRRGDVWLECFRYYAGRGRWDQADRAFSRAADLEPGNAAFWVERALLCSQLKRPAPAAAAYARAVALAPRNADLWQKYARLQVERGRPAEAAELLGKALALRPRDTSLLAERGRLYARLRQWDRVAADFTEALRLSGPNNSPFSPPNRVAGELVGWPEAFARAVALHPGEASLWLARARYFASGSEWEKAAADYARFIPSLEPEPGDGNWLEYAAVSLLAGHAASYDRVCAAAVARCGKTPDGYRGYVLARLCTLGPQTAADPPQLVRWVEPARAPGASAWHLHALGAACLRAGRPEEAVRWLEASRRKDPNWPGQAMNAAFLALAHQRLGHAEEARHWRDQVDAWLATARRRLEEARDTDAPRPTAFPLGLYPADWLIVQVLRREAGKGPSPKADR